MREREQRAEGDVTELLLEWSRGESAALDRLIPAVEKALRGQARAMMSRERQGHTLDPTALVNEVYLRLVDRRSVSWKNRAHFFGFAAQMMRRILVEHARSRARLKRGGDVIRVPFDLAFEASSPERDVDLLALDRALEQLHEMDARQARIVELRYFAGLTLEETAEVLEISNSLVSREWTAIRAWLYQQLGGSR